MSAKAYACYPKFSTMREVKVNGRILVTTLLDPALASAHALATLYKMRWNIKVDFRTIKATLSKLLGINCALQAAGFSLPSPEGAGN